MICFSVITNLKVTFLSISYGNIHIVKKSLMKYKYPKACHYMPITDQNQVCKLQAHVK